MGERKFGKWEVYLRASDPRGSARSGREDGGAEGLPAALCGGGERGGMETLASGGGRLLAGARQRNVGKILGGLVGIFLIF